ncbi:MAG: FGGY family carbohydrate kinase [Kiritimatiellia bacterium]|jgi:xylulokinase|nr:FGGY family carbohydrate kinase [Kiritimatiellia bacterium]
MIPEHPLVAAVDLGSTSTKVCLYAADGRCVASASRPTERYNPCSATHPEWVFWDPDAIWAGVGAAFREVLAEIRDPARVAGVAVTGMGMDGVPVDGAGRTLYPFISWHCGRTAPQAAWWERNVGAERTYAITGFPPWAMTGVMRVRWMMEHEPEILAQAESWLLIGDFVNFRLCGARATDPSLAGCMLLFDPLRRAWSDELVAASGIPRRLLPEIRPSGSVLGSVHAEAARHTGLRQGTPVILGGQDHLCGTLPVGAFRPGVAANVMGSWENLIATVDRTDCDWRLGQAGLCVQAHVAPGRVAVWGGSPSASALSWLREITGDDARSWEAVVEEAERDSRPGAGGVLFLPYLSAAACPVNDNRAAGAFIGLRNTTRKCDLFRAVIEALNHQFVHILQTLEQTLGTRFERIVASGGATRNAFWLQNKADVSGLTVEASEIRDSSPLGAALLAGTALGLWSDLDAAAARVRGAVRCFTPDAARHARYREMGAIYRSLAPALRPANHALAAWREQTDA